MGGIYTLKGVLNLQVNRIVNEIQLLVALECNGQQTPVPLEFCSPRNSDCQKFAPRRSGMRSLKLGLQSYSLQASKQF